MNSADAAWVAGIVEGEGTLILSNGKARIAVSMTDEDVIRALHQKTGVGNVHGPYKGGGSEGKDYWKQTWTWVVGKRDHVRVVLSSILPFLYERRTIQAMTLLDVMDELDSKAEYKRNFCPQGHSKPECLGADGRHCLLCRRVTQEVI